MIFKGSRYEKLAKATYKVRASDGLDHAALPIRFIPPAPATYRQTIAAHDRLDLLAARFYGNPLKFWLIADANSAMDPEDLLEEGLEVLIPPDRNR
jgi:nucleoid-associated protein YgaU